MTSTTFLFNIEIRQKKDNGGYYAILSMSGHDLDLSPYEFTYYGDAMAFALQHAAFRLSAMATQDKGIVKPE